MQPLISGMASRATAELAKEAGHLVTGRLANSEILHVMGGTLQKSVGSVFRVRDDMQKGASYDVVSTTAKRESMLIGLTTTFILGIQWAFTKVVAPLLERFVRKAPAIRGWDFALRTLATIGGVIFAEMTSRKIAPTTRYFKPADLQSNGPQSIYRGLVVPKVHSFKPLQAPLSFSNRFGRPSFAAPTSTPHHSNPFVTTPPTLMSAGKFQV